jgi:uncharacterized membrane protein YdjX (TVP38/TMEM64 family)
MAIKNNKNYLRLLVLIGFFALVFGFYRLGFNQFLNLDYLKERHEALQSNYEAHHAQWIIGYFLSYIVMAAVSLPGAAVLTLAGGAVFGFSAGLLLVSFASTIGATLAFLSARSLLRDAVLRHFGERLKIIDSGIKKEGGYYLLTLRLVPAFPFFMVNLVMGLTSISTRQFYLISQLGMLPGTAVFVNAGTQLAKIDSLQSVLTPEIFASFALLGVLPLLLKKLIYFFNHKLHEPGNMKSDKKI